MIKKSRELKINGLRFQIDAKSRNKKEMNRRNYKLLQNKRFYLSIIYIKFEAF